MNGILNHGANFFERFALGDATRERRDFGPVTSFRCSAFMDDGLKIAHIQFSFRGK